MLDSSARFLQELPRLNNTFFTSVQYSWLMGKNIHVDAGFQFTHAYSRTHSLWSDVSIDNPHAIDSLDVLYQFPKHIYEAFVNFNIPFGKKFTASAGLRISHTDDDGKLYQASIYRKHYNNLVPIVQLSYHPSENHELSYSLESGVNRPSFWDNAPIFIYSSAKEIDQNSSHLENETYFKSMISYTYRQKHVWILYNNYAYHALTGYQSYPEVDGKGNLVVSRTNLKFENLTYLYYSSNFSLFKGFWNLNPQVYIAYNISRGKDSTAFLNNRRLFSALVANNQLTLSKSHSWYAEVDATLRTPAATAFIRYKRSDLYINLSLMKHWKKWDIQLSVNDLANAERHQLTESIYRDPATYSNYQGYHLMPSFQIRISYRFGNQKIHAPGVNTQGLQGIEERL